MAEAEYSQVKVRINVEADTSGLKDAESAFDKFRQKTEEVKSKVGDMAQKASASSKALGALASTFGAGSNNAEEFNGKLGNVISAFKRIMFYRMVRTIIKDIGQAFKEGENNLYQWSKLVNGEFASSMDKIATASLYAKNSLGAMVAPIINALAPAIDWLIDKFVALLNVINQVLAVLGGATTWTKAIKYPKEYAKVANSAAGAAKKLGLAGIDQLTILRKGSGGGGGASAMDYSKMFEKVALPAKITNAFNQVKNFIQKHLDSLKVILSGAALVLGAILLFTGANIPLGLGLMAVGAYGLAKEITANWNSMTPELKSTIAIITGMVGGAFLALGAILAFSGSNLPLGLALMGIGALSLATAAVVNWGTLDGNVQNSIATISGIVSGGLLALGGILAFSGVNVPLGIALMAIGAAGVATALSVSWNNLESPIKRTIGTIATIVSTGLLALGAVLAFSGANVPLGIALMVAGAIGMATAAVNWDYAPDKVRKSLTAVTTIVGMSLLAFGAMLVLTGAAAPLGFGMMIAGGISLASAVAINWNYIPDKVKSTLNTVKTTVTNWWSDLKSGIQRKWNEFKNWWSNLSLGKFKIPTPHISFSGSLGWNGYTFTVPKMNVDWYAKGGFPNAGDLFIANENGAEMVGSMNGRTAVANQQEITDGIREGVYDAMVSALGNGRLNANVYLDGKQISGTVVSNINSETRRTGSSPLLSY